MTTGSRTISTRESLKRTREEEGDTDPAQAVVFFRGDGALTDGGMLGALIFGCFFYSKDRR
jgi:hypothetical protein